MDGMTRRALKVAITAVRRELDEATQDLARAARAQADDKEMLAVKDRISEANLSLSWLIETALYAK